MAAAGTLRRPIFAEAARPLTGISVSTKIHLRTNGEGLPVAATITAGEVSDYSGFAL